MRSSDSKTDRSGAEKARPSLKARLEESIVWICGGCVAAGVVAGLMLAKDSRLLSLFSGAQGGQSQGAVTIDSHAQSRPSTSTAQKWIDGQVLGRYKQIDSSWKPSCNTCSLVIRRVANDLIAFETNNAVIGSAYLHPTKSHWIGHAEFLAPSEGWDKSPLEVILTFDASKAEVRFVQVSNGFAWNASYQLTN